MKKAGMLLSVIFIAGMIAFTPFQTAGAQQQPQPAPRTMCQDRFKAMDTDGDGFVSKEEFFKAPHKMQGANVEQVFSARDTDGDGKLTADEFCSVRGQGRRGKNWQ
jgi:Ca2+-binding EF-hand superfamily protein